MAAAREEGTKHAAEGIDLCGVLQIVLGALIEHDWGPQARHWGNSRNDLSSPWKVGILCYSE